MAPVDILNAKVIQNTEKDNRAPTMLLQARDGGALVEAVWGKAFGEEVIGQFTSWLESIDTFVDFRAGPPLIGKKWIGHIL